jgi:hypothetical protein
VHALIRALVLTSLVAALVVVAPGGAGADPPGTCVVCADSTPPTPTSEGFYTSVRSQINRLNNGGSDSGGPPPCTEEDLFADPDKNGNPQHHGHYEYVPPINDQSVFRDIEGNTAPGTYWRLICRFDDGYAPFDDLVSIDFFDAINPQNLARVAVADALTRVPAPTVHMNPNGEQLVNFLTWLWVDGASTQSFTAPAVSVPGVSVVVTVSTGGVYWRMGDGTEFPCTGPGTPYHAGGSPSCSHTYRESSARQPGAEYHGVASITWTATYTVNGSGPYQVTDAVVRETPFSVRVAEGQAVVTNR